MTTQKSIPKFKSREEEAEFWDSHDFAEYGDEFEPVRTQFSKNLSRGITIRLDPAMLAELRARASRMGLGPTTLARMWILDRLESERRSPAGQADGRPPCPK